MGGMVCYESNKQDVVEGEDEPPAAGEICFSNEAEDEKEDGLAAEREGKLDAAYDTMVSILTHSTSTCGSNWAAQLLGSVDNAVGRRQRSKERAFEDAPHKW